MPSYYKDLKDTELAKLASVYDKKAERELLFRIQKDAEIFLQYYDPDFIAQKDLIQIILVKITKNITNLKTPETFKKWSHKIIVNAYFDYIRKINMLKKKINYNLTNDEKRERAKYMTDKHINPQEEILDNEIKDKVHGAIMRLPQSHRMVVLLRDIAGLSYEDIESILNINKGTVKSRIARARNKLKDELKGYYY